MIEYSVFMLPNPINPENGPKAYARNQIREVWSLDKFCKHIASHNSGYSRGLVKAVLTDMCDCMVEQLLNGNKIKLGSLGEFSLTISSDDADSIQEFTAEKIKAVNINFKPGNDFDNLLSLAEFSPVASRAAQTAVYRAEKKGEGSVDLPSAKKQTAGGKE